MIKKTLETSVGLPNQLCKGPFFIDDNQEGESEKPSKYTGGQSDK